MHSALVGLRWIGVVPVAVIGVFAATLFANIVSAILVFVSGFGDDNWIQFLQPVTVQRFVQAVAVPMGFIWFGSRTAPTHTLRVGWVLFTFCLLAGGALTFSEFLRVSRGQIGLIEALIQTGLWVAGSYWGLSEVRRLAANGPAPGWSGLLRAMDEPVLKAAPAE